MRIGTWNVECAAGKDKNDRRLRRLRDADCDIWVLTETHDELALGPNYFSTSTTQREPGREGGRWTTIWSRCCAGLFPFLNERLTFCGAGTRRVTQQEVSCSAERTWADHAVFGDPCGEPAQTGLEYFCIQRPIRDERTGVSHRFILIELV